MCYLGVIFSLFSSYLLCSFQMFYLQKYLLHNISLPPPIFFHFSTAVFPFAKEAFCIPHLPLVTCVCQFSTLSPLLLLPLSGNQWSRLCSETFKVLKKTQIHHILQEFRVVAQEPLLVSPAAEILSPAHYPFSEIALLGEINRTVTLLS